MHTLLFASDAVQHTGMSAPSGAEWRAPCGYDVFFSRTIRTTLPITFLCVVRERFVPSWTKFATEPTVRNHGIHISHIVT